MIHGFARWDGAALAGASVFVVDGSQRVVAATVTDASGQYAIAAPADAAGCHLLLKVREPIVGARVAPVGRPASPIDFDIASDELVTLSGTIGLPPGVPFDWANVSLTVKALDGLPPELVPVLLLNGTEPTKTSTYVTFRVTSPHFEARVMRGRYRFEVDRWIFGQEPDASPPPLELVKLDLSGGTEPTPAPIGFIIEGRGDLTMHATLGPSATGL